MMDFLLDKGKENENIIVVGAGIGGLCTGIRLQTEGFQVTIYEKNPRAGGCITYVSSEDMTFKIDESASLAINPLTYEKIFYDTGRNPKDYFRWIPLKDYYKVFYPKNMELNLNNNIAITQEEIQKKFDDEVAEYIRFIYDTSLKYLHAKNSLLNRPFIRKRDLFNLQTLKSLSQLKLQSTAENYVKEYVKSKELQQLILFQTFFMGVSPYSIPSIYTSIAANTQIEGMNHIEGGLAAYVKALEKLFLELGGRINYNAPIDTVVYNNKIAKGIIYKEKLITADRIVLNVDYINSQQRLLHRQLKNPNIISSVINTKKRDFDLSCSTFIIHLGFSTKFDNLEVHNIFIDKNFKKEIKRVFEGKLPETPSLYIYYPSAKDETFCSNKSHSVMNVMVRVPNLQALDICWSKDTKMKLYNSCIDTLEKILRVKTLRSKILFSKITTPIDFEKKYNYYKGCCFGIGHTYFQSLVFRPQIKDKVLKNLYYVGSSIHPGNGASIVMDCAEILSREIISDCKR